MSDKTDLIKYEVDKIISKQNLVDEDIFRKTINESLGIIKKNNEDSNLFEVNASEWIFTFLSNFFADLEIKRSPQDLYKLFTIAMEEIKLFEIEELHVSSLRLNQLISKITSRKYQVNDKSDRNVRKRQIIFDAALKVFTDKGYHKTTIDEIAKISKVGKGSIYRYFKSKEELLEELLIEHYENIIIRFKQIFSKDKNVLKQIVEMIEVWVDFIENNHVVYRLIQVEAISKKAGEKNMFYDFFITQLPMFKDKVIQLNKEEKLKTTSFYTVFYGIMGFIDGVVHKWLRQGMSYSLKDEIPLILDVLFNGFVGEKESRNVFV